MVNRQHMTAALIDSRDFLAAKRCAETEVLLPVSLSRTIGCGIRLFYRSSPRLPPLARRPPESAYSQTE